MRSFFTTAISALTVCESGSERPGECVMQVDHEDSVVRSSRREAVLVLGTWLAATAYTVGYCTFYGYERTWQSVTLLWGFPDWVFWGIVCPWLVCLGWSWWFAYRFMSDEPLEDTAEAIGAAGSQGPQDV